MACKAYENRYGRPQDDSCVFCEHLLICKAGLRPKFWDPINWIAWIIVKMAKV